MVWCRQATSHYLSQCWLRYFSPYFVTRPQSPNINSCCHVLFSGIEAFLWSNACIVPTIGRAKHHVVHFIRTIRMFCSVTWIVLRYEVCKILEGYVFFLDEFWGVDDPFLNPNILHLMFQPVIMSVLLCNVSFAISLFLSKYFNISALSSDQ